MSSLAIRLKQARKVADKTQTEVADAVGIKQPSYQALESGKSHSSEFLDKIANFLGVDANWLLHGDTNQGFIIHGNNINHGSKVSTQFNTNFSTVKNKPKFAPLISWVQAGDFSAVGDNSYDEYLPFFGDYGSNTLFWLEIKGDSMMPKFKQGDFVLINKDRIAQAGDYVVARRHDEDETTFKQYRPKGYDDNGNQYAHLVPLNSIYPHIDSRFQAFDIIGVAVEFTQKLV